MKNISNRVRVLSLGFGRASLRHSLLLALALLCSACHPEGEVSTDNNPAGVYALLTVDGKNLPAKISHAGADLEIRSGIFRIDADGTCSSTMIFVPPSGVESTREVTATWKRTGTRMEMVWKGAGRTTGEIEGDRFTMNNEGMVLVYRK